MKGVCEIFVVTPLQFDDRRSFGTLTFRNELKHRNFNCSDELISSDFCTLCRNFVRFRLVTPEFKA